MNVSEMAQRAYAPVNAPTRSDRSTEYQVIARITFRLKTAIEARDQVKLIEALHENRKLWRTLAVNVADDSNGLPADLRARLFYLAEFTDTQTSKVLARKADPVPLLEINTAILRGLKSDTGVAA